MTELTSKRIIEIRESRIRQMKWKLMKWDYITIKILAKIEKYIKFKE